MRVLGCILFLLTLVLLGCSKEDGDSGEPGEAGALDRSRRLRDLENEKLTLKSFFGAFLGGKKVQIFFKTF